MPKPSVVKIRAEAGEVVGIGVVMKNKSDFNNVIYFDGKQTSTIITSIFLPKGTMVIKSGYSGSSDTRKSKVHYVPMDNY